MGLCGSSDASDEPKMKKQSTPGGTTRGGTDDGLFVELNYKKHSAQSVADRQMVKEWLQCIVELPQYFDLFIENGYESIKFIKTMQEKSELSEIGIKKLGHQTLLWAEIKILKENDQVLKSAKQRKLNQNHHQMNMNMNMQMHHHQHYNNQHVSSYNSNSSHQQVQSPHSNQPIVVEGAGNNMPRNAMLHNDAYMYTNNNPYGQHHQPQPPQYVNVNVNVNVNEVPGAQMSGSAMSTSTNDDMYASAPSGGFSSFGKTTRGPTRGPAADV